MKKYARIKFFVFGTTFSLFFIFLPMVLFLFLKDLPNPRGLTPTQAPQTTKIFDRNGIVLGEIYGEQNRTLISLSDVPKHLQEATIAIEDKNFYIHPGFDLQGIFRALRQNLAGKPIQGVLSSNT